MSSPALDTNELPDELIIEDPNVSEDDLDAEPTVVRTVAFLADERASTFLLAETVSALVESQGIQEALVDISTEAGLAVARQLMESGVGYRLLDTPLRPRTDEAVRAVEDEVHLHSAGTAPFNPAAISALDANIAFVPAPAEDAGAGIDASEGTITALVVDQMKRDARSCLAILPPESGLRRLDNGCYVRLTLRLSE